MVQAGGARQPNHNPANDVAYSEFKAKPFTYRNPPVGEPQGLVPEDRQLAALPASRSLSNGGATAWNTSESQAQAGASTSDHLTNDATNHQNIAREDSDGQTGMNAVYQAEALEDAGTYNEGVANFNMQAPMQNFDLPTYQPVGYGGDQQMLGRKMLNGFDEVVPLDDSPHEYPSLESSQTVFDGADLEAYGGWQYPGANPYIGDDERATYPEIPFETTPQSFPGGNHVKESSDDSKTENGDA